VITQDECFKDSVCSGSSQPTVFNQASCTRTAAAYGAKTLIRSKQQKPQRNARVQRTQLNSAQQQQRDSECNNHTAGTDHQASDAVGADQLDNLRMHKETLWSSREQQKTAIPEVCRVEA
jgi:tRNA G18 (ribose-2'-O)-methylase SpoU